MSNYMRQPRARRPGGRMFAMFNTLGDDAPPNFKFTDEESAAQPVLDENGQPVAQPTPTQADPQTAYIACLKGGGSFGSCSQIPGVTPEMIAAAKAGKLTARTPSQGLFSSIPKTALYVVGGGLLLYLFTRRR